MADISPKWIDVLSAFVTSIREGHDVLANMAAEDLLALGKKLDDLNAESPVVPVPPPARVLPHFSSSFAEHAIRKSEKSAARRQRRKQPRPLRLHQ